MSYSLVNEIGHRLLQLEMDHAAWSQATFGSDSERGPLGPLRHLEKEAREAQEAIGDIAEYADCLLLLLDAKRRGGFTTKDLIAAAEKKLEENKNRSWPKPDGDNPVEHLK